MSFPESHGRLPSLITHGDKRGLGKSECRFLSLNVSAGSGRDEAGFP